MEHACTGLSEAETALHAHLSNHAWRAHGGDSDEGGMQSYQVPSKAQGETGYNMCRDDEVHTWVQGVHGGAWRFKRNVLLPARQDD